MKYKVRSGDTLGKIAKKHYGSARRFPLIVAANNISDPDKLRIGQVLIIPDSDLAAGSFETVTPQPTHTTPEAGDRMRTLSEQRLAKVHPKLASRGSCLIDLCAQDGFAILVTTALRTREEQDLLYAKGRTIDPIGRKYIATKAKGGRSWHNFGLAFNIVILNSVGKADWDTSHPGWKRSGELGKSLGLEWGGDWQGLKDFPHFQYTGGLTLARCRKLNPDGLDAIWAEAV